MTLDTDADMKLIDGFTKHGAILTSNLYVHIGGYNHQYYKVIGDGVEVICISDVEALELVMNVEAAYLTDAGRAFFEEREDLILEL